MGQPMEIEDEDEDIDPSAPYPMNLTRKKRLELLANLIVDKAEEDRKNGYPLLKKIRKEEKLAKTRAKAESKAKPAT